MAFCKNCGNKLPKGASFCTQCGTTVEDKYTNSHTSDTQDTTQKYDFFDSPDVTAEFTPMDIKANKWISALSYLFLLVLVPIFISRDSKFARFHSNQGFNLLLLTFASIISHTLINFIIGGFPIISVILKLLVGSVYLIINLSIVILAILGVINCARGKARKLPLIGKFDILSKIFK